MMVQSPGTTKQMSQPYSGDILKSFIQMFHRLVVSTNPSEKYESQLGLLFPTYDINIWENKTCSKAPNSSRFAARNVLVELDLRVHELHILQISLLGWNKMEPGSPKRMTIGHQKKQWNKLARSNQKVTCESIFLGFPVKCRGYK